MTKAGLIETVAKRVDGLTKKQVEIIVNVIFDSIKNALAEGDKVEIRDFGNFRLRSRKQRLARNPKTGALVNVPPKRVPHFKVGRELRLMVNRQGN